MISIAYNFKNLNSIGISSSSTVKSSILEILIHEFARNLYLELQNGLNRNYITTEDNLNVIHGRLLIKQHILLNSAHPSRFYCEFDRYLPDTKINRIFKASCKLMISLVSSSKTKKLLRDSISILHSVKNIKIEPHHFNNLAFNKKNTRFSYLINFCFMIITNLSPYASSGKSKSFSIIFAMNFLFEDFVRNFIKKHINSSAKKKSVSFIKDRSNVTPDIFIEGSNKDEITTKITTEI